MSASELVKSRPVRSSGPTYRPIAPVTPIPVVEPPPKAKRGRKPNPGSKSAREALRKESHSRIEKRRREKINETLTTLRELIAQDEAGTRQQHSPPPGPEREFKLELLERTVAFVRGLLDKTRQLEEELRELQGDEPPRKRKKIATPSTSPQAGPSNVADSVDDIELDDSSVLSEPDSPPSAPNHTEAASPRVFQPSAPHRSMTIAALLSPSVAPVLPSPPPSGHLKGPSLASEVQMETLSLPSPEVMFRRSSVSSQRGSVPVEEADDTAAAALLLQFSSKTPMSVLGMRKSEKYNQD